MRIGHYTARHNWKTQLEVSLTPDQYLTDICHVLINQQDQALTDIATNIVYQLGKYNEQYRI